MFIKIIDFKSVLHSTYRMTCQIQAPGAAHREEAQEAPWGALAAPGGSPGPSSQQHLFAWFHTIAPVLPHYQSALWLPT